jgi:lipoate synthase
VAEAIHLMKVKHAVITSVDRDEIKDGGLLSGTIPSKPLKR